MWRHRGFLGEMGLVRTRFFSGQLLEAEDFTQEQRYFLEKSRRHNRMLHGWGVVCGLDVRQGPGGSEVTIEPGYALGPSGDEIVLESAIRVNLCKEDLDGNVVPPCRTGASATAEVERPPGETLYVGVRYAECGARPVAAPRGGEGDPEDSRTLESFCVRVLTELPSTYSTPMLGVADPWVELPTVPWVILADVTLSRDCEVTSVDCISHRRHVPRGPSTSRLGSASPRDR